MSDAMIATAEEKQSAATDDSDCTGLPCFKSWRATYLFTLASFAVWVGLLVALTECFS